MQNVEKMRFKNIVGGGASGDGVDGLQRGIKIQQQHLVRNRGAHGGARFLEPAPALAQQLLVAQAGD